MAINIKKPLHVNYQDNRSQINTGEGLTEQSHKNETDMNYILRDYQRTGLLKHAKNHEGKYDDVDVQDFQEAMFIVKGTQNMFEQLPANLRKRFSNNPAQFLEFVQNPDNKSELQSMGILRGNDGIDISGAPTAAPTADAVPPDLSGGIAPQTSPPGASE